MSNELSGGVRESALAEYFDECREMLDRLAKNIALTEKNGFNKETIAAIYRDMHTIKGSSQLFGFSKIGKLAHSLETCLDPVRSGKVQVSQELLDAVYMGIDYIASSIEEIRESKREPEKNEKLEKLFAKFISQIEKLLTGINSLSIKDKLFPADDQREGRFLGANEVTKKIAHAVAEDHNKKDEDLGFGIFEENLGPIQKEEVSASAEGLKKTEGNVMNQDNDAHREVVVDTPKKSTGGDEQATETIRVQVALLNSLMNLVGELVLIRNQLLQHAKLNDEDTEFLNISQRLNVLTAELQTEVMKTRMQPIGNILTTFSRVVRDLSKELGKKIDFELEGAETELDKTVIEAVKDPLTHIIRNAVDHGIEPITDRKKANKNETAHILVRAYNESGQVIIEILDDGRGLDIDRIGKKAIEKGLLTKETLLRMSEKEVQNLIFLPGFSTAANVSNLSGRGVGMDVVKTNVERIGGTVELSSVFGSGTTITIKIPLSLAIVPALIVFANKQRYAIPQIKLVELLRIDSSEETSEKIETLQGESVLRLRGKLLPIISLNQVLSRGHKTESSGSKQDTVTNIVVLNADQFLFGLIVDEIDDSVDIVVKSLSQFLKDLKVYSGATIMGDGSVALTLDVMGIAEVAKITVGNSSEHSSTGVMKSSSVSSYHTDLCEFLLIDVGVASQYAIPLTIVNRIEEFDNTRFEYSGEQKVIRYRGSLLPIFSLPNFLNFQTKSKDEKSSERTPIVVIKRGDFYYGIEVVKVYDIVEVASKVDTSIKDRPGILGTIMTNDQIIVVADILGMIDKVKSVLGGSAPQTVTVQDKNQNKIDVNYRQNHKILVVEDSSFFRNHMRTVLQEAGFVVETAFDGANGIETIEKVQKNYYSIILSDIEMPIMDGFDFVKKVRKLDGYSKMPIFAITTKFSDSDIKKGKECGFTEYLEKLNAEDLLTRLDLVLSHNTK